MKIPRLFKITAIVLLILILVPVSAFYILQADPPIGPVTPTGETTLDTNWTQVLIADGLVHPWAADWLPNDEGMLITERDGRLRLYINGELREIPIAGVPSVVAVDQGGLMDVKVHPDFVDNRLIYFTASTGTEKANRTALYKAALSEDLAELTEVTEIYRVSRDKSGGQHFGSIIAWLPDGSLLLSIGDGGNPPVRLDDELIRNQAQNPELAFGKVLRMTDDGQPHPDNPFIDGQGDAPFVYTYGHRNVQGIAIRPTDDESSEAAESLDIWVTEHGARGGDELNKLEVGANYGWPKATYSVEYWGPSIADSATLEGANDPHIVWTPALAPCGLTFYTGDAFPEWKGDLLAGGLVARQIRRIHFNEAGEIDGHTTLQFDDRIRWVGMGPDGGLYILTDSPAGGLYRIDPK